MNDVQKALWGMNHREVMEAAREDGTFSLDMLVKLDGKTTTLREMTDEDSDWVADACGLAAAADEAMDANQLMDMARQDGTLGSDTIIPLRGEHRTLGSLTEDDIRYFRSMTQLALDVLDASEL